jgi:predicted amidohydrolase
MKVAAYQAPLEATHSLEVINLIGEQVLWCEENGVEILCCPEAVLGGLADYADEAAKIALNANQLNKVLEPLSSQTVTTIIGFTENGAGRLYNSAAVFHKSSVAGVYRKMQPAINKSVYTAGDQIPVFTIGNLTFGIIICYDSNFEEPARSMVAKGATALFIPTNNSMPINRSTTQLVEEARRADIQQAQENRVHVIRADVAGQNDRLLSYGSSSVVDPQGRVLEAAPQLAAQLIVATIRTAR